LLSSCLEGTSGQTGNRMLKHRVLNQPNVVLNFTLRPSMVSSYERNMRTNDKTVDIRPFKEQLRKRLPPDSTVLTDLLDEPDTMSVVRAETLIPHYLQRLERELAKHEARGPLLLRS
jgi:hypothetical protein